MRCFYVIVWGLLLGGCGLSAEQKVAITTFAGASGTIADVSAEHLADMRADAIAVRSELAALGWNDPIEIKLDADAEDKTGLAKQFTPKTISVRVGAVRAIKDYGDLLTELAANDSAAKIKESANSFITSLNQVRPGMVSEAQQAGIARIVELAAGGLIDLKRQQAIEESVAVAHGPINEVLDLLEKDLDVDNDLGLSGALKYIESKDVRAFKRTAAAAKPAALARLAKLDVDITRNQADRAIIRGKLLEGIRAMRTANETLYVSRVRTFRTEDLLALRGKAEELVTIYKVLAKSKK